jgi:hypothetical protein
VGSNGNGTSAGSSFPLLGGALGPITKSIIEASAVLPMLKEVMRFTDAEKLKSAFASIGDPQEVAAPASAVVMAAPLPTVATPVAAHAGQGSRAPQATDNG